MVLPLTAGLTASLTADKVSLSRAVAITRVDGTILRFAEVQDAQTIASNNYLPVEGLEIASIAAEINGGPTRIDLKVAAGRGGTVIDRDDVRNGLYDKAQIVIYLIDFRTAASGLGMLFGGDIGEIEVTDRGLVVFECVGILGRTRALPVENRSPTCRNWFGDERCGVNKAALGVATTVSSWDGGMGVTVASVGGAADQFYWLGTIEVTSGPSKGRSYAIRQQTGTALLTYEPLETLAVGNGIIVYPGCDYTNGLLGCQRYSNCINQQADPFLIGMDARDSNFHEWDA